MKRTGEYGLLCLTCVLLVGCATIITEKADLTKHPDGIRVYPPKVYLLVDTGERRTTLAYIPDYSRAYDVKPLTILAKHDFKIEVEEGQVKTLTSNQDTTAFLSFIKEGATLAAKAAGVGVSSSVITGTFGLETGIYRLDDDGVFRRVQQPK
jgi:hypothetical protein